MVRIGTTRTILGGRERNLYGAIVTFENGAGERLSIHREGTAVQAVRSACAIALAMDETARVICISTPETIYTSLTKDRNRRGNGPEARILRKAGFYGAIHPRLVLPPDTHAARREEES